MKLTAPGGGAGVHRPAHAAAGRQGAPCRRGGRDGGGRDARAGDGRRRSGRGRIRGAAVRHRCRRRARSPARRRCGTRCPTTCWSTRISATRPRPTAPSRKAAHVVKAEFNIARVTGVPMELRSGLAEFDAATGTLHALCRLRRRGAAEDRACRRARHRARQAARALVRRRRQFRHAQPALRRVRPGAVGGAASSSAR